MKKLLLLSLTILLFSCGDSEEQEEGCGCVKTNYRGYFASSSSNSYTEEALSSENLPCQDEEIRVITQSGGNSSTLFYVICCDNINNGNSGDSLCL